MRDNPIQFAVVREDPMLEWEVLRPESAACHVGRVWGVFCAHTTTSISWRCVHFD